MHKSLFRAVIGGEMSRCPESVRLSVALWSLAHRREAGKGKLRTEEPDWWEGQDGFRGLSRDFNNVRCVLFY